MSTPRTDNACGWPWGHHGRIECSDLKWSPDGPFIHSAVAREIECENQQLKQTVLATLSQRGQKELIVAWDRVKELERENAALRAELEAQAVVNGKGSEREAKLLAEVAALRKALEEAFAESDDTVRFHIIRNAVEALKEAQP